MLGDVLEQLRLRALERQKTIDENREIYMGLVTLKDVILNTNLMNLKTEEIEEFDLIRFKTLELLYMTEIELKISKGINIKSVEEKIEELYMKNGGNDNNEK